jgi:hypothetical protein
MDIEVSLLANSSCPSTNSDFGKDIVFAGTQAVLASARALVEALVEALVSQIQCHES